tara:strand:- start:1426 stop:2751 length:1326 start_codon:yes stop_codon:yes gene_type:complete
MAPKQRRRGQTIDSIYRSDNLAQLMKLGAKTSRHRYLQDFKSFGFALVLALIAQTAIYITLGTRYGDPHWPAVIVVCLVMIGVPLLSAFTLTAFRRTAAPIVTTVLVTAIYFSFAVTLLSALRVSVSYLALAVVFPVTAAIVSLGNIRFQSAIFSHVALIRFEGDAAVRQLLTSAHVSSITDPGADISNFDVVVIDPVHHHSEEWSALLARCYLSGVEIMPWSKFLEVRFGRVDIAQFDLTRLNYNPSQRLYARIKRILDILAVLLTLPLTLLLAAVVAAYIFLRDGGPVMFVQHRRGQGGCTFRLYKFRTMYKGTGGGSTASGDNRIIPGCGFFRRTRLDELPQIFNILRGEMTLIGPRPVAMYVAKAAETLEPRYNLRTLVLPGITGWAQVNAGYAETAEEEITKLAYDLYYIKHFSLDLDMQIIFRTVTTVIFGFGAR